MQNPLVSIVILTKNGGQLFKESISMIYSQKTTCSFEVVIVDSGSNDGTLEFLKNYPIRLFDIKPKDFSFGKTRDFGFSKAAGDYIVTLSQDVIPKNEHWLENIVSPLKGNIADIAQGKDVRPTGKEIFFWERKGDFYFTRESKRFINMYGGIGLSCTNMAVKKDTWDDIRFGDAFMNEDKMFQKKAFENKYIIVECLNAEAYHGHPYTLKSLIRRCENEGAGWRCVGVKYTFFDMIADFKQGRWVYGILIKGVLRREIKSIAEIFFLFIRPIFVFKGNLLNKGYKFN